MVFDINKDFYKENPALSLLFPPKTPSKLLWALFILYHPLSPYSEETYANKVSLIRKEFLPSFDPLLHKDLLAIIENHVLTRAQRSLAIWQKKLDERDALIDSLPYTLDHVDILDDMLAKSPKLWDQFEQIKDRLTKEQEGATKGDIQESLSEQQVI